VAVWKDVEGAAEALSALLVGIERLVALTGAGASAASGVPTYRGAGGSWTRYDPDKYASIDYFREDPTYYFSFFRDERYPVLSKVKPNPTHDALARLESEGRLRALVTQNIDGLHQEAGSGRVLELHGNTRRFSCEACGETVTYDVVYELLETSLPPRCPACDEQALRPDVVLFGEALPEDVLTESVEVMSDAELVLVIGSSLVVQPAASLPLFAKRAGGEVAILNVDPTPLDSVASLLCRAPADQVLPRAVDLLLS